MVRADGFGHCTAPPVIIDFDQTKVAAHHGFGIGLGGEMNRNLLPPEFADLERFAQDWDLPGTNARYAKRLASRMEEMSSFLEAMMGRVVAIKVYLDSKTFGDYSDQDRRLARLMFAVGVVGPAVEIFRQPAVPDSAASAFEVVQEPEL
jgi:hypothetical protein